MDPAFRLTPEMGSFKLRVLQFVTTYIRSNGGSPSYGEIAHGLGVKNTTRVYNAVRTLVHEGKLLKTKGERGIALPDDHANAVRLLRAAGYIVDEDVLHLRIGPVLRLPPNDAPETPA